MRKTIKSEIKENSLYKHSSRRLLYDSDLTESLSDSVVLSGFEFNKRIRELMWIANNGRIKSIKVGARVREKDMICLAIIDQETRRYFKIKTWGIIAENGTAWIRESIVINRCEKSSQIIKYCASHQLPWSYVKASWIDNFISVRPLGEITKELRIVNNEKI